MRTSQAEGREGTVFQAARKHTQRHWGRRGGAPLRNGGLSGVGWEEASKGHDSRHVVAGPGHVGLGGYDRGARGQVGEGLMGQTGGSSGPSQLGLVGQVIGEHHRPAWWSPRTRARVLAQPEGNGRPFGALSEFLHELELQGRQLRTPR